MEQLDDLARGREAFSRGEWKEAYARLSAADRDSPLDAPDLERLATVAYLNAEESHATAVWQRAHYLLIDQEDPARAVRCGFWLSLTFLLRGQGAQGAGWLARSQRLLDGCATGCAEQAYLLLIQSLFAIGKGEPAAARAACQEAIAIADRFADADLKALALLGQGQALIRLDRVAEGVALFDEAMIAVTAGEVGPIAAGIIYCAVVLECQRVFDLHRVAEWTDALSAWCASQPELMAFRARCLVHRSEIMQLRGEWSEALGEAQRACERLSEESKGAAGRAHYQQAEIHRLRGELKRADERYREAAQHGHEAQPGLSLLRLAQGKIDAAVAAIRRVADEAKGSQRLKVLGPYVEIMLAAADLPAAKDAAAELAALAADLDVPFARAIAAHAEGAVLLAEGDAKAAIAALREAWTGWQKLEAPYESARVRVLIALACQKLGDEDTAALHNDAAAAIFKRLGATPDLARLEKPSPKAAPAAARKLTGRELEVLRLVAAGKTNREIAGELFISEHTVARHVSNMFDKLGVTSRTAASAYAFAHDLI